MKQIGKKGKEWIKDRVHLIKLGILSGKLERIGNELWGTCAICGKFAVVDFDHIKKRSQGGKNTSDNIQYLCRHCHHRVDNLPSSPKSKGKKAEWATRHPCHLCKQVTHFLICEWCNRISVRL